MLKHNNLEKLFKVHRVFISSQNSYVDQYFFCFIADKMYTFEQTQGKIAFHIRLAFSLTTDFICMIIMFSTLVLDVYIFILNRVYGLLSKSSSRMCA